MTFKVVVAQRAQAELDKLPEKIVRQIDHDVRRLQTDPAPDGRRIKKLRGYEKLYRLRCGDYRLVFERQGTILCILRVLNRKDFDKAF